MKYFIYSTLIIGVLAAGALYYSYEPVNGQIENQIIGINTLDERVIINDSVSEKVRPDVKLERWGGEAHLRMWSDDTGDDYAQIVDDKIVWETSDKTYNFYTIDGKFEYEIILKEKPASNVIELNIETEGLVFYYQGELTQEEIDDGSFRPENIIGSYAVYHESKRNFEYKTGKAFHIYRPKIIDDDGNEVWAELHIENELLTITIPQDFLDKAVYPVIVDPTLGLETQGGTMHNISRNIIYAAHIGSTGATSGALTTISGYINVDNGGNWALALYDGDSTSPVNLEDYTPEQTGGSTGWFDLADTQGYSVESSEDYWVGVWMDTIDGIDVYYDTVVPQTAVKYDTLTYDYPNWNDPHEDEGGWTQREYSFHIDYGDEAEEEEEKTPQIIIFE